MLMKTVVLLAAIIMVIVVAVGIAQGSTADASGKSVNDAITYMEQQGTTPPTGVSQNIVPVVIVAGLVIAGGVVAWRLTRKKGVVTRPA